MDNNHRYRPYHRVNRRYDDDDCKHQYKKSTKYSSRYSSHYEHRNSNDIPYRRPYKNDYHYRHQQPMKSRSYSRFSSATPQPLMSTTILPPSSLTPVQKSPAPPPPPLPQPLVGPQERESWIRSVKKTKTNESTEQKTQYLETMLRMSQQKSLLKSSRFDQMRFADDQLDNNASTGTTTINNNNNNNNENLEQNSFHLIDDLSNHEEIRTLEKILFDNDLHVQDKSSEDHHSINQTKFESQQRCSGFLIDNCDEVEEFPPYSPTPPPLPLTNNLIEQNDDDLSEGRVALVSELNAADAERRQELKRQKRLHRKLQKKNKSTIPKEHEINHENNLDQISQLSEEVRQASISMTNEDRTEKVNLILLKIQKQQDELKKLKQYVMSMLNEQETQTTSSQSNQHRSYLTEDLFLKFLNQSTCWLCSGKMYAEVATQCDDNEQ